MEKRQATRYHDLPGEIEHAIDESSIRILPKQHRRYFSRVWSLFLIQGDDAPSMRPCRNWPAVSSQLCAFGPCSGHSRGGFREGRRHLVPGILHLFQSSS